MTCAEAREALLEMSPEQLSAAVADDHLAECAACAAVAARLRDDAATLRRGYDAFTPRVAAVEVTRRALRATRAGARERAARWAVVSVGLAAAIAVAVIVHGRAQRRPLITPPPVLAEPPASLAVTVPAGKNAIVFKTRDPKIDVVWIY